MTAPRQPDLDTLAPQVQTQALPSYYESSDVPHVLARIRSAERFFREVVDERASPDVARVLSDAHLARLSEEIQPYALSLALSLIALEDAVAQQTASEE